MKINKALLNGYENAKLLRFDQLKENGVESLLYDELSNTTSSGPLKASFHDNGKLTQIYSANENHVGVIAATRMGKTTSYVIPTVLSLSKQQKKRSMIISDPKGEIYKYTAQELKDAGYKIKLLNFRSYMHSECWNMLTPIYRKFKSIDSILDEVKVVMINDKPMNSFRGNIYKSQRQLNSDIENLKTILLEEVGNDIDNLAGMFITTQKLSDPYWEDSARELLKAFLWGMLEDSVDKNCDNPITEDTFSFSTILRIMSTFRDDADSSIYGDNGYFSKRDKNSKAHQYAKNAILENASGTRKCIVSAFNAKMSVFRESAMRLITSCNSFEISELTECPIALFIDYRDELKAHYQVISLFIQDAYRYLIETANNNNGKLDVPFYFILDEFGNFPALRDFDTTISACAGRNIFFILIIQSYAQLNNVYGDKVAEIIRDNLNIHIFFGSNNPNTLKMFSEECGETSRFSPLSALNGRGVQIDNYQIEKIPLVPKSDLAHFEPGECIITEANCPYVLYSRLERYYLCPEFNNLPLSKEQEYICPINPFDKKYIYEFKPKKSSSRFDF